MFASLIHSLRSQVNDHMNQIHSYSKMYFTYFSCFSYFQLRSCYDSSKMVCRDCLQNLENCINFRNDLISKQTKFYEFIDNETIEERLDEVLMKSCDPLEGELELKVEILEDNSLAFDYQEIESIEQLKEAKSFSCSYESTTRVLTHCKDFHNSSAKKPKQKMARVEAKVRRQCPECGILVKNLSEHQKIIHQSLKRFCCDFCDYSCYFKTKITRHLQRHIPKHRRKQFPCSECSFTASRKDALKSHVLTMHSSRRQKNFLCKECGKTFYNRSQLNIHTKAVHEKIRNHLCNLCGKSFFNSKDLEMHVKRHGEKNLACDVCGNLFFCTLDLKRHSKIHSEPAVPCEFEGCEKKFYTNSKMKTHIKVRHQGAKDFFCDYCRFVMENFTKV
jgi:hypothetical protein